MLQDFRFALRLLRRHRGYAVTAILTVALGVGANTAVFSVADSVLFRPLPFADSERLFVLRIGNPKSGEVYGMLPSSALDAAHGTDLFDVIAPVSGRSARAYVQRTEGLDVLTLSPVSREYVDVLGVRASIGRTFDVSDAGTRAIVLSHKTWIRKFGGDPAVVGRTIPAAVRTMDMTKVPDNSLRVVGVLPPSLRLPLLGDDDGIILLEQGTARTFPPLVRLKAGVTAIAAQAQLNALQGPEFVAGKAALRIVPIREELAASQDTVLWLLLVATAIVLLAACVNLANLILARGSARARELAVRAALGGSRSRLVRLLLVEGASIALFGTAIGLVAAYLGFRIISGQLPPLLARVSDPAFDARALAFAIGTACLAAVAFSVVPALRLSAADARYGLALGRLQPHARRSGRQLFVAIEVAICLALLVGAGLAGRSLFTLLSQDLGFQAHRMVATFDLPTLVIRQGDRLRSDTVARAAFVEARLREIREVAGVRAAGVASAAPFSGVMPDAPLTSERGGGGVYAVSSGYFRASGMTLTAGRDLTDEESFAAAPVGVLNETAARQLCRAGPSCLGRVVQAPDQPARTVIGVVRDARPSLTRAAMPAMYVPFDVSRFAFGSIVIDAVDSPENRERLKRALTASPGARVEVRSLDEARDRELSPFRFNAIIVGAFGALTLALAVLGVYGVMSTVVGERTREYGIRLALGATTQGINRHVLCQSSVPIVAGIIGGLLLAVWASRYVASILYGIVPLDAPSFGAAAVIVLVSAIAAALIPARRAGRVDPIVALRAE